MDGTTVALITLAGAVVLAALVLRQRGVAGGRAGVEREIAELRLRLDALVTAQAELPRVLAEGSARQARSLAEVRERLGALSEATRRLEAVGAAVTDLQRLLEVPRLRGALGEFLLEELLRQVLPASTYQMQYAFRSGERVDAVIRLGDRLVPVDAKFPLDACRRILGLDGDAAEREARAFRRSLRTRIDEVADKYIRPAEGTTDFVLMYVPAEAVYYEAVMRDDGGGTTEGLLPYAQRRKVMLVSPNTLYAYLAALAQGLRGLEVEARTREILDDLAALHQEFSRFFSAFDLVGKHLHNAGRQFDEAARASYRIQDRFEGIARLGPAAASGAPRTQAMAETPFKAE
jgi:DNA recombination protein RmuC